MRKILFRGKDINSGEWRYGHLFTILQGSVTVIGDGENCCQVDPETVGQYTGIDNRGGEMIFEGDVVKMELTGELYAVSFSSGTYLVAPAYPLHYWHGRCDIVGNIYDNPDLMEGETTWN